jgi:Xaa-Pro aminopeptidase
MLQWNIKLYWFYSSIDLLYFIGHALDILARIPLWKDGLDYRHGTGHGIGSYLNVHKGKQWATTANCCLFFFSVFSLINKLITVFETILTGTHLISFRPHARNVPMQASMTIIDG